MCCLCEDHLSQSKAAFYLCLGGLHDTKQKMQGVQDTLPLLLWVFHVFTDSKSDRDCREL